MLLTSPGIIVHEQNPVEYPRKVRQVPHRMTVRTRKWYCLGRGGDLRFRWESCTEEAEELEEVRGVGWAHTVPFLTVVARVLPVDVDAVQVVLTVEFEEVARKGRTILWSGDRRGEIPAKLKSHHCGLAAALNTVYEGNAEITRHVLLERRKHGTMHKACRVSKEGEKTSGGEMKERNALASCPAAHRKFDVFSAGMGLGDKAREEVWCVVRAVPIEGHVLVWDCKGEIYPIEAGEVDVLRRIFVFHPIGVVGHNERCLCGS